MLAAVLVAVLLIFLFWPRGGLIGAAKRFRELARRQQVEHALKHLHHCEFSELVATPESLAGALRISRQRAIDLASKLESASLLTSLGGRIELTESGRREALRIIRIHRLWERYFADHSGLDETLWHDEADRREHTTSDEEAQILAERLGHPRYDPHGAPIPTSGGDLPATRGMSLSNIEPGEQGRVVHVEDEPKATYEQLAAQGIAVGANIRVLDRSAQELHLEVDGNSQLVPPVVAGHVSVEPIEAVPATAESSKRLSQLSPGMRGRVVGLLPACRGIQRRRLLDLGLLAGTVVQAELQGPGGNPRAYRIRGALIALRDEQSDLVQIEDFNAKEAK